jgi:hypothetical protein
MNRRTFLATAAALPLSVNALRGMSVKLTPASLLAVCDYKLPSANKHKRDVPDNPDIVGLIEELAKGNIRTTCDLERLIDQHLGTALQEDCVLTQPFLYGQQQENHETVIRARQGVYLSHVGLIRTIYYRDKIALPSGI